MTLRVGDIIRAGLAIPEGVTVIEDDAGWRVLHIQAPEAPTSIPEDDALRLEFPMFDGLMAYFPNALAEVSRVSKIGNDQHNPGKPLGWARGKSTDHENKIMRHLVDVGKKDARGVRHAARLAWRALALLQEELERDEGYPLSRGSYL